jgi:protein-tyrosine-phosphatase
MSRVAIEMLCQSIEAFLSGDADRAIRTLETDRRVDQMNSAIFHSLAHPKTCPVDLDLAVRFSLLGLVNRIERVADRACNIAEETVYVVRGEVLRHLPRTDMRVLFFSKNNACRSQMAEAIARKTAPVHFFFNSAGTSPSALSPKAISFMQSKGIDISRQRSKSLEHVGQIEDFNVVITLSHEAEEVLPKIPYQAVQLNWDIKDPGKAVGDEQTIEMTYNEIYDQLTTKIKELTQGLMGAIDDEALDK